MAEERYLVKRVFKNGDRARIVDENLTREEAMAMVQEDIKSNPNAEYYMLVFDKMPVVVRHSVVKEDTGEVVFSSEVLQKCLTYVQMRTHESYTRQTQYTIHVING